MQKYTYSIVVATLLCSSSLQAEVDLGEITVVSASMTQEDIKDVTANVEVITKEELEDRGYTTLTQALSGISGFSSVSNGGLGKSTSVFLRGMSSKHILVLIDGVRYNDPTSLNGAPFADLMVEDIESIEIVKGSQSGIWGADASAGVINIITKKAQKGYHASMHIQRGSFDSWNYGATLSVAQERYSLKLSYNVVDSDGFSAVAPYGEDLDQFEDDEYKNQTLNLQASYSFDDDNKLELIYTQIKGKGDADPFDMSTYSFDPDGEYRYKSDYKFYKAGFRHKDSIEELYIYAQKSDFSRDYLDSTFSNKFDGSVDEYGINSKVAYRAKDFVLFGADYKKFEHKNSIDKSYDVFGLFATNTNHLDALLGGSTILTETLRYDNYSNFENKTTYKVGIKHIHSHIEGLVTSANYSTAYNIPTMYNLYDPFSGNENLNPENIKSFDISVEYKNFKVTYFNNKIEDMIEYVSKFDNNGNWIGGGYENIEGKSKIDGIELSYQNEIYQDLLLTTNYTHLCSAKDKDGKALPRRAKDTFNISFDYYGISKLHLGVDANYIGKRYDRADNQGEQTGKYTILNLTADYQLTKDIQLYGKIENLTDKYYQSVYGYASSPRAFYAGIRGHF